MNKRTGQLPNLSERLLAIRHFNAAGARGQFEQASFAPVAPADGLLPLEETWTRGNSEDRSIPIDTWAREKPTTDGSVIPAIRQSTPGDTWTRDAGVFATSGKK